MFILFTIVSLLVLIGLIHIGTTIIVNKIKGNPAPYPIEVLLKEPIGDEVFITREDGTKIRAISHGEGPTVVMAHGFGISLREWNVVWDLLLDAGYRVIVFDQRGHGKSTIGTDGIGSRQMAGDYEAVLTHFDVRDSILVGHSMGGFMALVFMLTYPEVVAQRVGGLVLFATLGGKLLQGAPQNLIQIPMIKYGLFQKVARSEPYGWLLGASLCGNSPSPATIQASLQELTAQPLADLVPAVEAMCDEDYYPQLGEISVPSVVICGDQDKSTPKWHSERMARDIPNARLVWVENKGHILNWEAPEALVKAIESLPVKAHEF